MGVSGGLGGNIVVKRRSVAPDLKSRTNNRKERKERRESEGTGAVEGGKIETANGRTAGRSETRCDAGKS
jgi:hypothetical protein